MTLASDVEKLSREVDRLSEKLDATATLAAEHELQISGDRGTTDTLSDLAQEIRSLRRAAYWVAGILIASSIGFAFSALALLGH